MQQPCLDDLLLTDSELSAARQQVQELAYFKWQAAGCPDHAADDFWRQAELEWIEYDYVPDRYLCGGRP